MWRTPAILAASRKSAKSAATMATSPAGGQFTSDASAGSTAGRLGTLLGLRAVTVRRQPSGRSACRRILIKSRNTKLLNPTPHRCGARCAVGDDIERNVPLHALRIGARLAGPRGDARQSLFTPCGANARGDRATAKVDHYTARAIDAARRPIPACLVGSPEFPMIGEKLWVDCMTFHDPEGGVHTRDRQIIVDHKPAGIEENMVVRTKTQKVFSNVRAMVWAPKRANMSSLGIRTAGAVKSGVTNLAVKIVQLFDLAAHRGVANDTLDRHSPFQRQGRLDRRQRQLCRLKCLESEAAHLKAALSDLPPVTLYSIKPVVPVAAVRGERLVSASPENTNWKSPQVTSHQCSVPEHEMLMIDLFAGGRVPPSLPSIDYVVSVIFIIRVAARKNNRFCADRLFSDNATLKSSMHALLIQGLSVRKDCARWEIWVLANHLSAQCSGIRGSLCRNSLSCNKIGENYWPADAREPLAAEVITIVLIHAALPCSVPVEAMVTIRELFA